MGRPTRRGAARLAMGAVLVVVTSGAVVAGWAPLGRAAARPTAYAATTVVDVDPDPDVVETTIVADERRIDIGGITANAFAFNGTVPGPEFHLVPGQRVVVHFRNDLDHESTGIHWHGIELNNRADGSPLTQDQVPPGGEFVYVFVAPRPGIYWYHPHHETSTNQVFKGLYGAIVVTDPNEATLVDTGVLPGPADSVTLTLSDITVCKTLGSNDVATYRSSLPWAGDGPLPVQNPPTPTDLCDTPVDGHGEPLDRPLRRGDVPNIQFDGPRTNEGQRVLTNGVGVGGRSGSPAAPGAVATGARTRGVRPGQGLRLRLVNAATTRYFRLVLTDRTGTRIPLVRIGGEGGLLDDTVVEGSVPGGFDLGYEPGELLMAPSDRADVVVAVPATATGVMTLWTQDFRRTGGGDGSNGWTNTPTVPVAHFRVSGTPVTPAYAIADGTPLRSSTGDPQELLVSTGTTLLDPATFGPARPGTAAAELRLTANGQSPSIDDVTGMHHYDGAYTAEPHTASTRYAHLGDTLELRARNTTGAHHSFHLHGFSFQPVSYSDCQGRDVTSFVFPEPEFVDNIDIPGRCTLTYRVRLTDRPQPDGVTPGGGLGRWMIHCHIFFHHHLGMMSELVITDSTGDERPYVDTAVVSHLAVDATPVTVEGTSSDPEGGDVTLTASVGEVVEGEDGHWTWTAPAGSVLGPVYVTATDPAGNQAQTLFFVDAELPPTGSDGDLVPVAATLVLLGLAAIAWSTLGRRARPATVGPAPAPTPQERRP